MNEYPTFEISSEQIMKLVGLEGTLCDIWTDSNGQGITIVYKPEGCS